jgi:nitrogen-specific signal transduction histidine kinase
LIQDQGAVVAAKKKRAPDSHKSEAVLLDEISELPLAMQIELLRLLQGGGSDECERVEIKRHGMDSNGHLLNAGARDDSLDGVILIDAAGKLAHINQVAATLFEVDAQKAIDQIFEDLPSRTPAFVRLCRELKKFRDDNRNLRRFEVDLTFFERERTFLINPMVLTEGKYAAGILFILQDLTCVRDHDRARIDLLATLSRELRTPLTSIGLAAQLLEQGLIRRPKLAKILLAEFMRLSHLTDELVNAAGEHRILDLATAIPDRKKFNRARTKRKLD